LLLESAYPVTDDAEIKSVCKLSNGHIKNVLTKTIVIPWLRELLQKTGMPIALQCLPSLAFPIAVVKAFYMREQSIQENAVSYIAVITEVWRDLTYFNRLRKHTEIGMGAGTRY